MSFLSDRYTLQFELLAAAEFADRADIKMVNCAFAGALTLAKYRVKGGRSVGDKTF